MGLILPNFVGWHLDANHNEIELIAFPHDGNILHICPIRWWHTHLSSVVFRLRRFTSYHISVLIQTWRILMLGSYFLNSHHVPATVMGSGEEERGCFLTQRTWCNWGDRQANKRWFLAAMNALKKVAWWCAMKSLRSVVGERLAEVPCTS